ncbi:hypothetical protein HNQ88_003935 [Aureibacter tunicatorum]|uniref:Outer membrane protein beta-barrel domain-containing protein n=2 Tax=Aureibacter tunicatorum TaxID=866807 RepID=A0AAE3XSP0_9BACT|nr:hypothetical protein [Aureibacter tunicatorum]
MAQDVSFGVKAGANFSNAKTEADSESATGDVKAGLVLGVFSRMMLTDAFAIQPEILYSQEGYKDGKNAKMNLSYVNIPVMAKVFLAEGFNLQAGPQLGILAGKKAKIGDERVDIDDMKSINFSLNFGAGYDFEQGLSIEARYCLGLTNVDDSELAEFLDMTTKTRSFQLTLGYRF